MGQLMANRSATGVPTSNATLDTSLPFPELAPGILRDLFKNWSGLDDSRFLVETVSGGITNWLLKVSVKEGYGRVSLVTVRLYGPNTELVIDRKREMQALPTLSAAGFGAELLAMFGNGMVQSFINARTLSPKDMIVPKVAAEVARQLRRFHQLEVPGSKEPQLWNDIFKFFHKASSLKFDDSKKQKMYDTISFDEVHNDLIERLSWASDVHRGPCFFALIDLTDRLNAPVVFAHNDLPAGNLMQNDDEEKLYFIDFEYGSYSYRGYDIANHFNEYAGFECDYSLYPNKYSQFYFFKNYLQPDGLDKVSSNDLEAFYVETDTFKLASHVYWALWGLIQAKVSLIEFDYLEYFFLQEFKKQKETTIARAREYLGIVSTGAP